MTATRVSLAFLIVAAFAVADLQAGHQQAYQNFILSKNPVGNWQFDGDGTDATANANHLSLMANATTPATGGVLGGTLHLPGPFGPGGTPDNPGSCFNCPLRLSEHVDGAYVDTPAGNPLNFTGPTYSIVAWVNPELEVDPFQRDPSDPSGSIGTIFVVEKRRNTNFTGDDGWWDYSLWMANYEGDASTGFYSSYGFQSAMVDTAVNPGSGNIKLTSPADTPIPQLRADRWTMLGMTWSQNNFTKYYINGELRPGSTVLQS